MSSKLKKWILSIAIVLVVAVGAMIGFTFLSRLSTSTIYDLRFVENISVPGDDDEPQTEKKEIFEKTVYMTAAEDNYFDVELIANASAMVGFNVYSTNTNVATIDHVENEIYTVHYLSAGKTEIVATTVEESNISEKFTLFVKSSLATDIDIEEEEGNPNIVDTNEVNVYSDGLEYRFNLSASRGDIKDSIDFSAIYVVDDYDQDIFENIYIDDSSKQLVIVAKENETKSNFNEIITLQVRDGGSQGNVVSSQNVKINVRGYHISDMQLVLSQTSNFDGANSIFGSGIINEGEVRVREVNFTASVNTLYVRVRVVYTNGEIRDVSNLTTGNGQGVSVIKHHEQYSQYDYFELRIDGEALHYIVSMTLQPTQTSSASFAQDFTVIYRTERNGLQTFYDNELYEYVEEEDGTGYYRYIYWDTRFQRDDVITEDGKIVGFIGDPPACGRV